MSRAWDRDRCSRLNLFPTLDRRLRVGLLSVAVRPRSRRAVHSRQAAQHVVEGAILEYEKHNVLDFRECVGHRQVGSQNRGHLWPVSTSSCAYCASLRPEQGNAWWRAESSLNR
jgi:hypothetical protein